MQKVYIDNNAWDVLFYWKIDLLEHLPPNDFEVLITREEEFEIDALLGTDDRKKQLKHYIQEQIQKRKIKTDKIFGFYDERFTKEHQRNGGFSSYGNDTLGGRFIRDDELTIMRSEKHMIGNSIKTSGLFNHEADIAIAARSLHSIVLTNDNKKVLRRTSKRKDSFIVNLSDFDNTVRLSDYIAVYIEHKHEQT